METPLEQIAGQTASAVRSQSLRVAGHELRLFSESPEYLGSLLADIQAASQRIWLEVYIFADDDGGRAVAATLGERAAAGVDVRLLYDAVGSQATPQAMFDSLTASGVQVIAYHSLWDALRRFALFDVMNRRNHRKLCVIDGHVGYFGGMNVTDATQHPPGASKTPTSAGWRDVHVRIDGPQVAELAESFTRSWRRALRLTNPRRSRAYRRALLPGADESIRFFDSGPGRKYSRAARIFRRLFRAAQQTLLVSMAYFLPTGSVLRALLDARRRGVEVRVIVPGKSDVRLVEWATRHLAPKLVGRGVALFERHDRMVHSKVMVVDSQWTVVGSCNLDPRSLDFNLEFLAVIRSAAFASAVTAICEEDLRHSHRVTMDDHDRLTRWQRLRNTVAYWLRWWL